MNGDVPEFPPFSGTEQIAQSVKIRIAAVAWEKAADETEFRRLCLQHARGDIDLFADRPAETDATERMRAIATQQEIERSVTLPATQPAAAVVEGPAERAAPIAGTAAADRMVPRRPEPAAG